MRHLVPEERELVDAHGAELHRKPAQAVQVVREATQKLQNGIGRVKGTQIPRLHPVLLPGLEIERQRVRGLLLRELQSGHRLQHGGHARRQYGGRDELPLRLPFPGIGAVGIVHRVLRFRLALRHALAHALLLVREFLFRRLALLGVIEVGLDLHLAVQKEHTEQQEVNGPEHEHDQRSGRKLDEEAVLLHGGFVVLRQNLARTGVGRLQGVRGRVLREPSAALVLKNSSTRCSICTSRFFIPIDQHTPRRRQSSVREGLHHRGERDLATALQQHRHAHAQDHEHVRNQVVSHDLWARRVRDRLDTGVGDGDPIRLRGRGGPKQEAERVWRGLGLRQIVGKQHLPGADGRGIDGLRAPGRGLQQGRVVDERDADASNAGGNLENLGLRREQLAEKEVGEQLQTEMDVRRRSELESVLRGEETLDQLASFHGVEVDANERALGNQHAELVRSTGGFVGQNLERLRHAEKVHAEARVAPAGPGFLERSLCVAVDAGAVLEALVG
mmetsp:Transcript_26307/g.66337  ORF Transcript_26307/g.66337 Transcript_26307/m.66337 type:complete len:502 (-) Transcript_26307:4675-6180(-)